MKQIYKKSFHEGIFQIFNDCPYDQEIITVHQTHSNIVLNFNQRSLKEDEADGIVASYKDLDHYSFAIKTADCLPVLLLGKEKFALIHAGWRGLQSKILSHPSLKEIKPISAIIGPSISKDSFEVTDEFISNFPQGNDLFYHRDQKLFFDLQAEAINQLKKTFENIQVIDTCICTYKNLEYNSYRRDKTTKRNWNIFSKECLI